MITQENIRPDQCLIGFGIPTNESLFRESISENSKDFAVQYGIWPRYHKQFVEPLIRVYPSLKKTGVEVDLEFTFSKFTLSFANRITRVIILFSHWTGETVEFSDGMIPFEKIIDAVPHSFDGLVDLCVCHPKPLAMGLRSQRPNCIVRFTNNKASPVFWLYFYKVLFSYLKSNTLPYMEAMLHVMDEFKKK